ncbi:unnamed protein product [Phytophthora lilii]|uniref:Unnamed protein product n=1 Tax=Phytophthora lilii TaxID=2077276 RepID=A0A9W6XDW9_9STRA|nr:unnamed protein product [Phytophthora lilii]
MAGYTSALYALWSLVAVETAKLTAAPSVSIERIVDGVLAVVLMSGAVVLSTSSDVQGCASNSECGHLTAGYIFLFVAFAFHVGSVGLSFVDAGEENQSQDSSSTYMGDLQGHDSGTVRRGQPNQYISTEYVDWVWENRIGSNAKKSDSNWNALENKNWILDHIVQNKGSLNYCVRWDSKTKLTKAVASTFEAMLNRQFKAWNRWLVGYDRWPYDDIKVNVVGFAVRDAGLF